MERLLDFAVRDRLVGQPAGDYSDLLALADKTEEHGQYARHEFWLRRSEKAKQAMYNDQLVHHPAIWIEVDREAQRIRRCRVYEIRF